MSLAHRSEEIVVLAAVWLACYGWLLVKVVRHHAGTNHESFQILISDIWASMAGLLPVLYLLISQFTHKAPFKSPVEFPALMAASQLVGLFCSLLRFARLTKPYRCSRMYRATYILLIMVSNALCGALIFALAMTLIARDYCVTLVLAASIYYLLRGNI